MPPPLLPPGGHEVQIQKAKPDSKVLVEMLKIQLCSNFSSEVTVENSDLVGVLATCGKWVRPVC